MWERERKITGESVEGRKRFEGVENKESRGGRERRKNRD